MSAPYDAAAEALADIFDQIRAGTLTPADAAPLISAELEAVAPTEFLQFNKIEQVLGRITGLFFVDGVPADTLGAPGASAIDLTAHKFYGPKDAVDGWPAGVTFVGATGPAGTITGASAHALTAGATPTVTLGGTPQARTFDFGIPAPDLSALTTVWNNGATTFTALKMDVTDTASQAASKLLDLLIGGVSKASISKLGVMTLAGALAAASGAFAGNVDVASNSAALRLGASQDVSLLRDAANILAQRNGVNAQTLRIYKSYTDPSNHEFLTIGVSGSDYQIGATGVGTGLARDLRISVWTFASNGKLLVQTDNTYDFGAPGANRVRDFYLGRHLTMGGTLTGPSSGNFAINSVTSGTSVNINGGAEFYNAGGSFQMVFNNAAVFRIGTDTGIFRDQAGTFGFRANTQAHTLRTYRTYTDGSNNAYVYTGWSSTTAVIATVGNGTGARGNLAFGTAALATTATAGYLMMPSAAGVSTGVPADIPTGQAPFVYDSTNNKIGVYSAGAWRWTAALT